MFFAYLDVHLPSPVAMAFMSKKVDHAIDGQIRIAKQ
jgi:hypothetical protein